MLMFMSKMRKSKKGYTLTELIVVIAILGVLAAVATPLVSSQLSTAKTNTDEANRTALENVVKRYIASHESLPSDVIADVIHPEINPIPTSQTGKHFVLDKSTNKVTLDLDAPTATGKVELKESSK